MENMEETPCFFAVGKYDQISVSSRSLTSLWLHHDVGGIARGLSWPEVSVKFSKFILSQMSTIHIGVVPNSFKHESFMFKAVWNDPNRYGSLNRLNIKQISNRYIQGMVSGMQIKSASFTIPKRRSSTIYISISCILSQWIGLRENLQETIICTTKYRAFL